MYIVRMLSTEVQQRNKIHQVLITDKISWFHSKKKYRISATSAPFSFKITTTVDNNKYLPVWSKVCIQTNECTRAQQSMLCISIR